MLGTSLGIWQLKQPEGAPPAPPAITRIAKGTAVNWDDLSGAGTLTIPGVSLASGSTLVVFVAYNTTATSIPAGSVKWGTTNLIRKELIDTGLEHLEVWVLENATGGTNDITVGDLSANGSLAGACAAVELQGATSASFDVSADNAPAASASLSTGTTPATSQANEMLLAAFYILQAVTGAAGTWGSSFTAGQRVGTNEAVENIDLHEGYRVVTATGTYEGTKSLPASQSYVGIIATFKSA